MGPFQITAPFPSFDKNFPSSRQKRKPSSSSSLKSIPPLKKRKTKGTYFLHNGKSYPFNNMIVKLPTLQGEKSPPPTQQPIAWKKQLKFIPSLYFPSVRRAYFGDLPEAHILSHSRIYRSNPPFQKEQKHINRKGQNYLEHHLSPGYFKAIREIKALMRSSIYQKTEQDICLDLSNHELYTLPPILKEVKKLKILNLSNNHLFFLPPWIIMLKKLKILYITNNPHLMLSTEIKNFLYSNRVILFFKNPKELIPIY